MGADDDLIKCLCIPMAIDKEGTQKDGYDISSIIEFTKTWLNDCIFTDDYKTSANKAKSNMLRFTREHTEQMERYGCVFSNINDPSTLKRNSTYFGSSWKKQNDKKTHKLQRFFAHFAFPLAQHIEEVQSIANRVSVPLKTALYDFIVGFIKSMTGWKGSRKTVKSAKVSVYDLNVGQKQFDFNS